MSRRYPNRSEYGLSSDDDDEAAGVEWSEGGGYVNQLYARPGASASPSRQKGQRWRGQSSGLYNSRNNLKPSDSLSLAEFDKDYVDDDDDDERIVKKSGYGEWSGSKGGAFEVIKWLGMVVEWLVKTSKWKVALVGCLLGLSFAVVHQSYWWLLTDHSSDAVLCSTRNGHKPCLSPNQLQLAQILAEPVRRQVHRRAGQYECGVRSVSSRDLRLEELQSILPSEYTLESEEVINMLTLIRYNPQWGIRWLDEDKSPVPENSLPSSKDILSSSSPHYGVFCWFRLTVGEVWDQLKLVFIIVLGIIVLVAMVRWYVHTKESEMRSVYIMVDRVLDVLKRHHENTRRNKHLLPYLAIIHVRDMLIPPSERKRSSKVWERACKWLSEQESRVRVENQMIAGQEFEVWRWIQVDPPQTEVPWSTNGEGDRKEETADRVKSRKGDWLGTAFEDYPPGVDVKVAPPAGSPSPFIRLKNMFEATKYMDDEMAKEIENSVLERCSPHGDVVHVYIDRRSPFGCVYLKMDSLQSSGGAYKALHGGWYKGKLVTAKYIPESKYYKWFPNAASAKTALKPSPSSSSS